MQRVLHGSKYVLTKLTHNLGFAATKPDQRVGLFELQKGPVPLNNFWNKVGIRISGVLRRRDLAAIRKFKSAHESAYQLHRNN